MAGEYSNIITCIYSDNLDLIEQAITEIFELEGCRRISKPTKPDNSLPLINQLRARSGIPSSPLLVIGLFVGKLGWTIINTSEPDLFGLRAKDSKQPRLSHLAKITGCDAFHLSVYEDLLGALLEADGSGKTIASGFLDGDDDDMWFHDEPITHLEGRPYFSLIKVSPEIQQATQASFKQLQKLPNHVNLKYEDRPSEFELVDRVLGLLLVNSNENFWNFWYKGSNILYKVYAEPELLEKNQMRLLFFQVKDFHLRADTPEIWEFLAKKKDYRVPPTKNYGIELNSDEEVEF